MDSESAMYAPCVSSASTMAAGRKSCSVGTAVERDLLHLFFRVSDSYIQTSRQTAPHPPKLEKKKRVQRGR